MGQLCKYRCVCGNEITYEVPFGEDTYNFGQKLPCGQCGQTGNMQFAGNAWVTVTDYNFSIAASAIVFLFGDMITK